MDKLHDMRSMRHFITYSIWRTLVGNEASEEGADWWADQTFTVLQTNVAQRKMKEDHC